MNGLITLSKRPKEMEIIEKIKTNKSIDNQTEIQKICLDKLQSAPLPDSKSEQWRLSNKSKFLMQKLELYLLPIIKDY